MAREALDWRCRCGKVHLRLDAPRPLAVRCYCTYCRHFILDLGAGEALDDSGGVDYLHLTPDRIEIVEGREHLRTLAYSRRGGIRWYAACCSTPLLNTFRSVRMPYVTLTRRWIEQRDSLPPARAFGFPKSATGPVPPAGPGRFADIARVFWRVGIARLTGRWRRTPFFDEDGAPAVAPELRPRPGG